MKNNNQMKETLTKMEILGQNQKIRENLQKSKMRLQELKKTLPKENEKKV